MTKNKLIVKFLVIVSILYFNCGAFTYHIRPWPHGKITYTYSQNFPFEERMYIDLCMLEWERETNVDFEYCHNCETEFYVLVIVKDKNADNPASMSTVGYCSEPTIIFGQLTRSVVIHELGHAIGLLHEHQRPDRDSYIKIQYKNIDKDSFYCFEKRPKEEFLYDYTKFPYDYNSIMHYYNYSFSKNGKLVIVSPQPTGNYLPSKTDILKVIDIYGKPKVKKQ